MKARHPRLLPLLCLTVSFSSLLPAATNQYWNPGGSGGDGNWGTSPGDKNWNVTPGAPAGNTFWQDSPDDVAVFQDALGGTVTVFDTIQTAGIIQNGADYAINAGTITLIPDSSANQPFVDVQGGTLTIDSSLSGSNGLFKNGAGNLILSGSNSYVGTTGITAGTLTLTGGLTSSTVNVSAGASLINQSGGFANSTILGNAGSLTLGVDDAVASYVSNGGALTAGAGTLTTTTAALNDGSSIAGSLKASVLTSNGMSSISGVANVTDTTTVQSGTLGLTGTLVTANLKIASGAILIQNGVLGTGSPALATTFVTNEGRLVVQQNSVFHTYTSNGGALDIQSGQMLAQNVFLNDGSTTTGGSFSADQLVTHGNVTIGGSALVGSARIASGSLLLQGSLASNNVEILSGATLLNQSGGLSDTAALVNAGSLTLGADDVVASYVSNGGALTAGAGTLTTTTAALNDGSSVAGSLKASVLTSNGMTSISGIANVTDMTTVQSGTLGLTGTLATANLKVASGAVLIQNGVLGTGLPSLATTFVTNEGRLVVQQNSVFHTYTSNGGALDIQSGQMFAQSVFLNDKSTTTGGSFSADLLVTQGNVTIGGSALVGSARIASGSLLLQGSLASNNVEILSGATLLNQSGGLSNTAFLVNAGSLTLGADDVVASYVSDGGELAAGAGTLTTTTAALNDGSSVSGSLKASVLTSNGMTSISGITNVADTTTVQSGTLGLTGTLATANLNIAASATVIQNGVLGTGLPSLATTVVTNEGRFVLQQNSVLHTYTSNGGTLDIENGQMLAQNVFLNDGSSTTGGSFSADLLVTHGNVTISGSAWGNSARIASGSLLLQGSLASNNLEILSGATLLNQSGGLSDNAALANAGSLTLGADDAVASYVSDGGKLTAGAGRLTTTDAALNDGSSVAGSLKASTLTSNGAVSVSGTVTGMTVDIASGTLTNTGKLSATVGLNINGGATLIAGGNERYAQLTTSGAGAGTWQGDLNNSTDIAPGGDGSMGALVVKGNFSNAPSGTLRLDIGSSAHDVLTVSGNASFDGTLVLDRFGPGGIAPFVPINVVSAGSYSGNFTTFTENLPGAVWFNPSNGDVTRLSPPAGDGNSLFGASRNQSSTWISLYDDVIEPGVTNITRGANGKLDITSGIADAGNPDLMWALAASFTPGGLDSELLNRLSPQAYAGISDYSVQANRSHMRTALAAPAFPPAAPASQPDSKGGAKEALAVIPGQVSWEAFAAVDYFNVETDNLPSQADHELSSAGFIAGVRAQTSRSLRLTAWLAADDGTVSGDLIKADASGFSLGFAGELLLDEMSATRITGGLAYGVYQFDGSRESASATAGGWSPGRVNFSDVENDAIELYLGIETIAYQDQDIRLIPSAALRYSGGTSHSFTERTGAGPGAPIALHVDDHDYSATLAELGVSAEADLSRQLTLRGRLGISADLNNDGYDLSANFVKGERTMHAHADSLSGDLIFLGLEADYRISDSIRMHFGSRAEFRDDAETQIGLNLSSTFRF